MRVSPTRMALTPALRTNVLGAFDPALAHGDAIAGDFLGKLFGGLKTDLEGV